MPGSHRMGVGGFVDTHRIEHLRADGLPMVLPAATWLFPGYGRTSQHKVLSAHLTTVPDINSS